MSFENIAQEQVSSSKAKSEKKVAKINVGVNIGLNSSTVFAENRDTIFSDDFSRRTLGHFGFKVIYNMNAHFSLRSGFTLNTRGYTIKEEVNLGNNKVDTKFTFATTYIDIPLMLQINLAPTANGGLFLKTGGYYGFAVGGNISTSAKGDGAQLFRSSSENLKIGNSKDDDIRKEDYGFIVGGGLKFNSFEVGLAWDIGLANVATDTSNNFYVKNRLFRIDVLILAL